MYFYVLLRVVFLMLKADKRMLLHVRCSTNEADINVTNPRANGAKRCSGRKPGARVTNSAQQ